MFNQLVPSREGGKPGPRTRPTEADSTDHGQPARAPLARPTQSHLAQPDRNHVAVESRRDAVLGEKRDLGRASAFVERLDRPAPTGALAVVDFAEIKHLPLNHAPVVNPAVFDHRPIPMLLAVLAANLMAQKHAPASRRPDRRRKGLGRHCSRFSDTQPNTISYLARSQTQKIAKNRRELVKLKTILRLLLGASNQSPAAIAPVVVRLFLEPLARPRRTLAAQWTRPAPAPAGPDRGSG